MTCQNRRYAIIAACGKLGPFRGFASRAANSKQMATFHAFNNTKPRVYLQLPAVEYMRVLVQQRDYFDRTPQHTWLHNVNRLSHTCIHTEQKYRLSMLHFSNEYGAVNSFKGFALADSEHFELAIAIPARLRAEKRAVEKLLQKVRTNRSHTKPAHKCEWFVPWTTGLSLLVTRAISTRRFRSNLDWFEVLASAANYVLVYAVLW